MAETRCDKTDLITTQCAHCRGLSDVPEVDVGPPFTVRWEFQCPRCSDWVLRGEQAGFLDDRPHCTPCYSKRA